MNSRSTLSTRPDGMSTFSRRSAAATSSIVRLWAVSRELSIQMRIEKRRSPAMMTSDTPGSLARRSWICVSASVDSSSCEVCSPESASHRIGLASASRLATTGSSTSSGSLLRARATRSRTSFAASSTLRSRSNSTVICDTCSRLSEVRWRTPSMAISWSSSGCVTEVSITSGAAPGSTVVTATTGGSTSGYSRLGRRSSAIAPKRTITSDITVERTGRSMQVWESFTPPLRRPPRPRAWSPAAARHAPRRPARPCGCRRRRCDRRRPGRR